MAKNLGIYRCAACGYTLEVVELGQKKFTCGEASYARTCFIAMPLSLAATNPWSYWNPTQ